MRQPPLRSHPSHATYHHIHVTPPPLPATSSSITHCPMVNGRSDNLTVQGFLSHPRGMYFLQKRREPPTLRVKENSRKVKAGGEIFLPTRYRSTRITYAWSKQIISLIHPRSHAKGENNHFIGMDMSMAWQVYAIQIVYTTFRPVERTAEVLFIRTTR